MQTALLVDDAPDAAEIYAGSSIQALEPLFLDEPATDDAGGVKEAEPSAYDLFPDENEQVMEPAVRVPVPEILEIPEVPMFQSITRAMLPSYPSAVESTRLPLPTRRAALPKLPPLRPTLLAVCSIIGALAAFVGVRAWMLLAR